MRLRTHPVSALLALLVASTAATAAVTPAQLADRITKGERLILVDVRSNIAYAEAHIPGAINIPVNLLPHKRLPLGVPVILYGDGLGLISDGDALKAAQSIPELQPDVLAGGFGAWETYSRVTTRPPGLSTERLEGITYDALLKADPSDIVLVDLSGQSVASTAPATAESTKPGLTTRTTEALPVNTGTSVSTFAARLGVPIVHDAAAAAGVGGSAIRTTATAAGSTGSNALAAPSAPASGAPKLLVIVADDSKTAEDAARSLQSAGYHRYTILIGGTEIIRYDGHRGLERMGGDLPVISSNQH